MEERKARLLIVDDEENILNRMAKYILNNMNCFSAVYTAKSGEEALDLIYRQQPEVMLLDVHMPGKNGLEVMKEAKNKGICPKTIILSGYDTFSYVQQALRLGAVDYLLKPCRSTELCERLSQILNSDSNKTAVEQPKVKSEEKMGNLPVYNAREYIREHLREDLNLKQVAEKVGVSTAYLSTLFSQHLGCGFIDYLNKTRIEYACNYMQDGSMKIYEIAFQSGFHDEKYFSRVFKKVMGQSPSEYRKSLGVVDE
ncbi:MAG: response regulator [Lachnospiraceae bacterium]|nr:response regulator [Lachnospiraceae bacterium]